MQKTLDRNRITDLLNTPDPGEIQALFDHSKAVKKEHLHNRVYLRGLIEVSNICRKNCLYCGVRKENTHVNRYLIPDEEILELARFAHENRFGSIVLQAGENPSPKFTDKITRVLKGIKTLSDGKLGVTLSCGEQPGEVYEEWFNAGAHRYLLRIETGSQTLYHHIHPPDTLHDFDERLACLADLRRTGYQVGSGFMIGFPGQTSADIADDILFLKQMDVDMIGLGPYITHPDTPFHSEKDLLFSPEKRLDLSIRAIAILRILMKDVNIVASTAVQSIDEKARERAIEVGANVIMPNLTPKKYQKEYHLYRNKSVIKDIAPAYLNRFEDSLRRIDHTIGYDQWGDPVHYFKRTTA